MPEIIVGIEFKDGIKQLQSAAWSRRHQLSGITHGAQHKSSQHQTSAQKTCGLTKLVVTKLLGVIVAEPSYKFPNTILDIGLWLVTREGL